MRKPALALWILIFPIALPGCASITAHSEGSKPRAYAGVRQNVHSISHPKEADQPMLQPLGIFELPFDAVADMVMLPWDLNRR